MIDIQKIVAIDVHTHDNYRPEFDVAFAEYLKSDKRPTIAETVDGDLLPRAEHGVCDVHD